MECSLLCKMHMLPHGFLMTQDVLVWCLVSLGWKKTPKPPLHFGLCNVLCLWRYGIDLYIDRTVGIISIYVSKVNRCIYLLIMVAFILITWFCFVNSFILDFQSKRGSLPILFQKHYYRGTKINIKKGESSFAKIIHPKEFSQFV